ncbi:tRNA lysidine(34) synthetase TilS [Mucilaginibacter sp. UR6-1]|uniref:tRNA lysidine(34) synthetase TilS n=1 Tax=Mucilaginibacter sp. UR6-1 TaxID=1435643 RepID=UPI001E412B8F|nr:tRNA lysidine(34) synthetase TilS [Mucilaginibacter sp. UR6-1]MCC8411131.1 tRNA lysidine(34) synthetase TilS [Mucilaginibacter sp. UR6-1]
MLPVKRFTEFIEQNNLFTPQNSILLAVSGGIDSVLLSRLFSAAGYSFGIAHCNFGLRGSEADADQQFCRDLATQLGVPFHTINFDTTRYADAHKISIQMAARELRYNWFEQVRQQHNYHLIALGHHKNDTIETILLNLTRGTGIAGLHGILPKNGVLVRPLLFLTRDEIATIVRAQNIPYVEDSSNASTKYARNKIRHEVVPKLRELNPNLENTFDNNLRHFRQLEELLELKVDEVKKHLFVQHEDEIHLAVEGVKALQPQQLLLYKLLQPYGFTEPVVDDVIASLDAQTGKWFASATYRLTIDRGKLILAENIPASTETVIINESDHEVHFDGQRIAILHDDSPLIVKDNPFAVSVDADKLIYPLTIRHWQQSDFFYPLGMKTRKKLSDFFINLKIPLHKKQQIPLLINGNGDIMWVAGHRPDERYKVSHNTKKVTIFELFK